MYTIAGLVIVDSNMTGRKVGDIPVVANERTVSDYMQRMGR